MPDNNGRWVDENGAADPHVSLRRIRTTPWPVGKVRPRRFAEFASILTKEIPAHFQHNGATHLPFPPRLVQDITEQDVTRLIEVFEWDRASWSPETIQRMAYRQLLRAYYFANNRSLSYYQAHEQAQAHFEKIRVYLGDIAAVGRGIPSALLFFLPALACRYDQPGLSIDLPPESTGEYLKQMDRRQPDLNLPPEQYLRAQRELTERLMQRQHDQAKEQTEAAMTFAENAQKVVAELHSATQTPFSFAVDQQFKSQICDHLERVHGLDPALYFSVLLEAIEAIRPQVELAVEAANAVRKEEWLHVGGGHLLVVRRGALGITDLIYEAKTGTHRERKYPARTMCSSYLALWGIDVNTDKLDDWEKDRKKMGGSVRRKPPDDFPTS